MTFVSADVLTDSISALGLVIAFYYGLTGFACVGVLSAGAGQERW